MYQNERIESLGEVAYNAYCASTDWKSAYSGAPLPPFDQQKPEVILAWEAAGSAALNHVVRAAPEVEAAKIGAVTITMCRTELNDLVEENCAEDGARVTVSFPVNVLVELKECAKSGSVGVLLAFSDRGEPSGLDCAGDETYALEA